MLYGLEDDEDYVKEFGLVEKKQLNIKKIILIGLIIVICILVLFVVFKNILKKEEDTIKDIEQEPNTQSETQVEMEQSEIIITPLKNSNEENTPIDNNQIEGEDVYKGNHMQIATHDLEKIKVKFIPQANPNAQEIIKNIYYSDEKQVYLTFDDGPSKDITPQILDILKANDVKATFFVLGARVDLYPQTLKRIYEEGHYIANHGYSHKYSKIYENKDTTFEEYIQCENSIRNALGNQEYNTYLFRFPGGSSGGPYKKVKAEARELFSQYGIAYTNWNCLTGDAENKNTKEECIQEMLNTKANQNSLVLLMHDANDKQQTVDSLPEIIQYLKNEGYTFKTFYEVFR